MGRLLAVPVSVRLLPRTMLLVSLVGALGSIGLILLSPQALAVIWVGTIGLGFWLASIFPSAISLAGRHMKVTGRVTGLFLAGASVGAMVLPWLIGQLFEWVGPQAMLLVILIDLLVALVIFATIFWLTRRREPTQSMV
jgi:fucose permease